MFPIRSGIGSGPVEDPVKIMYQAVAASAMHEIGQQAILDTSILMFHQQAAEVYYREENGIPISTREDGTFELYTPQEEKQIRADLINVVMKYHILDENGMAARLTPIIEALQGQEPISIDSIDDPFIRQVVKGQSNYSQALSSGDIKQTMAQILNFETIENIGEEDSTAAILDSYGPQDEQISVAVYEDNTVQCACNYCEGFFQILEKETTIDRSLINPIQQIMLENYNY